MSTRDYIKRELVQLGNLRYDHDGMGSLPARADSMRIAEHVMCAAPIFDSTEDPVLSLEPNGTIEATFFSGPASLVLKFPCDHAVVVERHIGHTVSSVSVEPMSTSTSLSRIVRESVSWLLGHTVSVEGA